MKRSLLIVLLLSLVGLVTAQTPPSRQWASAGATTRFGGTGLTLAYGQQDFFAPGTDARFGLSYIGPAYYDTGFAAEVFADALAFTRDPAADTGLTLVAYGGLGPRLLVQSGIYDYLSDGGGTLTAYQVNVGGVGGFETRLNNIGVFLEVDLSLPAFGLIGPRFRFFPTDSIPVPRLILGGNLYF